MLSFNHHKIEHSINLSASSSNDFKSNDKIYYCGFLSIHTKVFAMPRQNCLRIQNAQQRLRCVWIEEKKRVNVYVDLIMLLRSMHGIRGIKLDIRALSWQKWKKKKSLHENGFSRRNHMWWCYEIMKFYHEQRHSHALSIAHEHTWYWVYSVRCGDRKVLKTFNTRSITFLESSSIYSY